MILACHADALFWVGRYLERAEATVRCLNYAANSIIHLRADEARVEARQLVETLGLEAELASMGSLEGRPQLVTFLLSDTANPGSVASAVTAVPENLRSTRDRIPIELWEEANGLYLRFPKHGHADLRGVMDATRMLRLTSSLQAYHRQHGHAPDPDGVVRYLLHAPDLPRSVQSCLLRAEECLKGISSGAPALDGSRRRAGLLRARLELGEIEAAMVTGPVPVLSKLYGDLVELAGDVEAGVVPPIAMAAVRSQYLRPGEDQAGVRP